MKTFRIQLQFSNFRGSNSSCEFSISLFGSADVRFQFGPESRDKGVCSALHPCLGCGGRWFEIEVWDLGRGKRGCPAVMVIKANKEEN